MNLSDCPTCGGSGELCPCPRGKGEPHAIDIGHTAFWQQPYPTCPDCDGLGVLIPDEWVEAAAQGITDSQYGAVGLHPSATSRLRARAALAAVLHLIEGSNEMSDQARERAMRGDKPDAEVSKRWFGWRWQLTEYPQVRGWAMTRDRAMRVAEKAWIEVSNE